MIVTVEAAMHCVSVCVYLRVSYCAGGKTYDELRRRKKRKKKMKNPRKNLRQKMKRMTQRRMRKKK